MLDVLTIETVSLQIKETQKELNNKFENEKREEINATLRKNENIYNKEKIKSLPISWLK